MSNVRESTRPANRGKKLANLQTLRPAGGGPRRQCGKKGEGGRGPEEWGRGCWAAGKGSISGLLMMAPAVLLPPEAVLPPKTAGGRAARPPKTAYLLRKKGRPVRIFVSEKVRPDEQARGDQYARIAFACYQYTKHACSLCRASRNASNLPSTTAMTLETT